MIKVNVEADGNTVIIIFLVITAFFIIKLLLDRRKNISVRKENKTEVTVK
jgi:hypothetical protein